MRISGTRSAGVFERSTGAAETDGIFASGWPLVGEFCREGCKDALAEGPIRRGTIIFVIVPDAIANSSLWPAVCTCKICPAGVRRWIARRRG